MDGSRYWDAAMGDFSDYDDDEDGEDDEGEFGDYDDLDGQGRGSMKYGGAADGEGDDDDDDIGMEGK